MTVNSKIISKLCHYKIILKCHHLKHVEDRKNYEIGFEFPFFCYFSKCVTIWKTCCVNSLESEIFSNSKQKCKAFIIVVLQCTISVTLGSFC